MTTKTIARNNKILSRWISIHYIRGCPVALSQDSHHHSLKCFALIVFGPLTTFPTPPHGFSPLAFQSMSMCVCVCVLCKRSWVGGLVTPHHPLPPSFGWVCHHILKWLVKYLCVWVCPWWRAKIDRFFRWLFGRKNMAELPNNFYLTQRDDGWFQ